MYNICMIYVWYMYNICRIYVVYMYNICSIYVYMQESIYVYCMHIACIYVYVTLYKSYIDTHNTILLYTVLYNIIYQYLIIIITSIHII